MWIKTAAEFTFQILVLLHLLVKHGPMVKWLGSENPADEIIKHEQHLYVDQTSVLMNNHDTDTGKVYVLPFLLLLHIDKIARICHVDV